MTKKGLRCLQALIDHRLTDWLDQVVIGQDKRQEDYSMEIENLCRTNQLNHTYRKDTQSVHSPYGIAISWRWLLPSEKMKLIVLHDSLLPKYRGFAPLVNQLIHGEDRIGVTALFASTEYDKGPVIDQVSIPITYPIKIEAAIHQLSEAYAQVVVDLFKTISTGDPINAVEQDESQATYSLWRDEQDYRINWSWSAEKIGRFIDAVGKPYAGARCTINGREAVLEDVEAIADVDVVNRDIGKVIFVREGYPVVVCGSGLLSIHKGHYVPDGSSILPMSKFRSRFS